MSKDAFFYTSVRQAKASLALLETFVPFTLVKAAIMPVHAALAIALVIRVLTFIPVS